jgi:hypothetical protein
MRTPSAFVCSWQSGNVAEVCPDYNLADFFTAVFGRFTGRPQYAVTISANVKRILNDRNLVKVYSNTHLCTEV